MLNMTFSQYLETVYKPQYESLKAFPEKKKTKEIYEEIMSLKEETDDLIEGQILIEEKDLAFKINVANEEDEYNRVTEELDITDKTTGLAIYRGIKILKEGNSPFKIEYISEVISHEYRERYAEGILETTAIAVFLYDLIKYIRCKLAIFSTPKLKEIYRDNIEMMIYLRNKIARMYKILSEDFNITIEYMMEDSHCKMRLLDAKNIESAGKYKIANSEENLLSIKEILQEEILSTLSIVDCIFRPMQNSFYFPLDKTYDKAYDEFKIIINSSLKN